MSGKHQEVQHMKNRLSFHDSELKKLRARKTRTGLVDDLIEEHETQRRVIANRLAELVNWEALSRKVERKRANNRL